MQATRSSWVLPLGLLFMACTASGCVVGQRINYAEALVEIHHGGQGTVALATQDRRPYVARAEKGPDYVGVQRSGWGIPHPLRTQSQNPLADDLSVVLKRALSQHGYRVSVVRVNPGTQPESLIERLKGDRTQCLIVLYIDQWESDTYSNIGLEYKLKLLVMDGAGRALAKATQQGKKTFEGSAWHPVGVTKRVLPEVLAERLADLLNEPRVVKALQEATALSPQPPPASP